MYEEDDDDRMTPWDASGANGEASCPECGGDGFRLGRLGALTHMRCEDCGSTYAHGTPFRRRVAPGV